MTKSQTKGNKKRVVLYAFAILILIVGLVFTGWLQYGFAYVRCGKQPVIASEFAASFTYNVPGDKDYKPNMLTKYFCSTVDADERGFSPAPGTVLYEQRNR